MSEEFSSKDSNINQSNNDNSPNDKYFVLPKCDLNLFDDKRVLSNLRTCEERYVLTTDYFSSVQSEINEDMRKTLTTWMLEVGKSLYFLFLVPTVLPLYNM